MTDPILPGRTLGMLGSGQLGRMFTIAARRLGYRVHVYSPESDTPTGQVADREFVADYLDEDRLREFAATVDVVSYEFENVPARVSDVLEAIAPVRPGPDLLHVSQNRIREKETLRQRGFPVPEFRRVESMDDLREAAELIGLPAVLKTASSGYDGKGQVRISPEMPLEEAWSAINEQPAILEEWVEFDCEVSVVACRGAQGDCKIYGPIRNVHRNHILDLSTLPALVAEQTAADAVEIAHELLCGFKVEGVVCIELFALKDGSLVINEIAPRPHNSGHLTIEACTTCQFEQQVRGICGLRLGSTEMLRPGAMANLLGDVWLDSVDSTPDWQSWSEAGDVKLHLYGKHEPRAARKMGHVTALAETPDAAAELVLNARASLIRQ